MDISRLSQGGQINTNYTNNVDKNLNSEIIVVGEKEIASPPSSKGQDAPSQEDIKKSVDKLNKFLEGEKVHAVYEIHEKLKDVMIKIVNNDTNEVVLEIPSKKILDMVANMLETVGILVDHKA